MDVSDGVYVSQYLVVAPCFSLEVNTLILVANRL